MNPFDDRLYALQHEYCADTLSMKLQTELNLLNFVGKTDTNADQFIPSRLKHDPDQSVYAVR